jgi:hypothetical protein
MPCLRQLDAGRRNGPLAAFASEDLAVITPIHCLTCRARIARSRGCCGPCLARHRKAVAEEKTTWADLEARGLALPVRPMGAGWRWGFAGR